MQFSLISNALPVPLLLDGFIVIAMRWYHVSLWTGTPEKWPLASTRRIDTQKSSSFKLQLFLATVLKGDSSGKRSPS